MATGFFLDRDTYYTEQKALKPAHDYILTNSRRKVLKEVSWFKWNYQPRDISLKQTVSEFADLLEHIVYEQVGDKRVILPLSGGLDSRTQAAVLRTKRNTVQSFSYSFQNGHNESSYGKRIATACGFSFEHWEVPGGYLWHSIEGLARINSCYSEFTHPRQMAFIGRYETLGDLFSLGHWGDVLFDDMGVSDDLPLDDQVSAMIKKIIKKGGMELGRALWQAWELSGTFDEYIYERVKILLTGIDINESANARIRAFKSLFWAPRWTSVNVGVFESVRPVTLPYYDDRMCQFICTVPEKYLAKRKIQIEYLKLRAPELARIPWQAHRPFNLYNYHRDKTPYNLPYRLVSKVYRSVFQKNYVQRNWELQFLGETNDRNLRAWLFDNTCFSSLVPKGLVNEFYNNFRRIDPVYFSHAISMLLTLSIFAKQHCQNCD